MTSDKKLIQQFLDNPESLKYNKIKKILIKLGFFKSQGKGSHVKFSHIDYFLTSKYIEGEKVFFTECPAAGISQEFYPEDIAEFLEDLPQWIAEYQSEERKKRSTQILFRVKPQEKLEIEKRTKKLGFSNVSEYLRNKALA